MASETLQLIIGGAIGASFGAAIGSTVKQAKMAQEAVSRLSIGSSLAKEVEGIQRRLEFLHKNEEKYGKSDARTENIKRQEAAFQALKQKADSYGITLGNAAQKAEQLGNALNRAQQHQAALERQAHAEEARGAARGKLMETMAIGATFAEPVKAALEFSKNMGQVATLVDTNKVSMKALEKQAKDMGLEFGRSGSDMAKGMYQALSSGVSVAKLGDTMRTAAKASVGGATEIFTAIDGITSAVGAYGESNLNAKQAADSMFQTVADGKINFQQISQYMGEAAPAASAAHMKFGELGAAIATLTVHGVQPAQAFTRLRSTLDELMNDSSRAAETFTATTGKSFKAYMEQGGTYQGALQTLTSVAKQNGQELDAIFESIEAKGAARVLGMGQGVDDFAQRIRNQANSAGLNEAAFQKMADTQYESFNKAKASWEETSMVLGATLLPGINAVGRALGFVLAPIGWMAENLPFLTGVIGGLAVVTFAVVLVTNAVRYAYATLVGLRATIGMFFTQNAVMAGTASAANGTLAATTFTLGGAFRVMGAAIMSVPVLGWILAGVAAIIAIIEVLESKFHFLGKAWAWIKGEEYKEPESEEDKAKRQTKEFMQLGASQNSSPMLGAMAQLPGATDGMDAGAVAAMGNLGGGGVEAGDSETIHIDKEGKIVKPGKRGARPSSSSGGTFRGAGTGGSWDASPAAPAPTPHASSVNVTNNFYAQTLDPKTIDELMERAARRAKEEFANLLGVSAQRSFSDATLA